MGKDVVEKRLEEYDDVFVDIFNNLVLMGQQVLKEKDLIPRSAMVYIRRPDGTLRGGMRDIWKENLSQGRFRLVCGIENQSDIDNTMPERVMGYEFADYETQIKKLMDDNKIAGRHAGARRIFKEQKLKPVITCVLYYGKQEWKQPKRLHEILQFPEDLEDILKPYVADYPMNLIQVSRLTEEERRRLTSDFRIVAEYLACRGDIKRWACFVDDTKEIRHVEELLDLLWEISGDERFQILYEKVKKQEVGKEHWHMCEILDYVEGKGVKKGLRKGVRKGLRKGVKVGVKAMIKDNLEMGYEQEEIIEKVLRYFSVSKETALGCYKQVVGEC